MTIMMFLFGIVVGMVIGGLGVMVGHLQDEIDKKDRW